MDAHWASGLDSLFLMVAVVVFIIVPIAAMFVPWEWFTEHLHAPERDED